MWFPVFKVWSPRSLTAAKAGNHLFILTTYGALPVKTVTTVVIGDHDDWAGSLNWIDEDELIFVSEYKLIHMVRDLEGFEVLENDVSYVVSSLANTPRKFLIRTKDNGPYFTFDLDQREKTFVVSTGEENRRWFDSKSNLRIKSVIKDGVTSFLYREEQKDSWTLLDHSVTQEDLRFDYDATKLTDRKIFIEEFGRSNDELFVYFNDDGNTNKFAVYNLAEGKVTDVILGSRIYDMGGFGSVRDSTVVRRSSGEIIGIKYYASKTKSTWFDSDFQFVQETIDAHFPDANNELVEWTDDATTIIFKNESDRHPGKYYLFKLIEGRIVLLHNTNPPIDKSELGKMETIVYASRDGSAVRGYLTIPPGINNKLPKPAVVMPHDEPWSRNYWEYSASVQFFSTRGYVVLQSNYRGSAGYGLKYFQDGFDKIGTIMVDDIADGVRHFVDQGTIDPENIFIVGEGFGGYLTYMSMIKYPEIYSAGLVIGGITHLEKHYDEFTEDSFVSKLRKPALRGTSYEFGYWEVVLSNIINSGNAENISPYFQASRIKSPIRIFHGKQDWLVSAKQTELMDEALSKTDVDYKVTYFPGGELNRFAIQSKNRYSLQNKMRSYAEAEDLFQSIIENRTYDDKRN